MGLSELITTKKMSKEEFEEHEHPRDSDGKFRKKNSGSAPKKIKKQKRLKKNKNNTKRNVAIGVGAAALAGGAVAATYASRKFGGAGKAADDIKAAINEYRGGSTTSAQVKQSPARWTSPKTTAPTKTALGPVKTTPKPRAEVRKTNVDIGFTTTSRPFGKSRDVVPAGEVRTLRQTTGKIEREAKKARSQTAKISEPEAPKAPLENPPDIYRGGSLTRPKAIEGGFDAPINRYNINDHAEHFQQKMEYYVQSGKISSKYADDVGKSVRGQYSKTYYNKAKGIEPYRVKRNAALRSAVDDAKKMAKANTKFTSRQNPEAFLERARLKGTDKLDDYRKTEKYYNSLSDSLEVKANELSERRESLLREAGEDLNKIRDAFEKGIPVPKSAILSQQSKAIRASYLDSLDETLRVKATTARMQAAGLKSQRKVRELNPEVADGVDRALIARGRIPGLDNTVGDLVKERHKLSRSINELEEIVKADPNRIEMTRLLSDKRMKLRVYDDQIFTLKKSFGLRPPSSRLEAEVSSDILNKKVRGGDEWVQKKYMPSQIRANEGKRFFNRQERKLIDDAFDKYPNSPDARAELYRKAKAKTKKVKESEVDDFIKNNAGNDKVERIEVLRVRQESQERALKIQRGKLFYKKHKSQLVKDTEAQLKETVNEIKDVKNAIKEDLKVAKVSSVPDELYKAQPPKMGPLVKRRAFVTDAEYGRRLKFKEEFKAASGSPRKQRRILNKYLAEREMLRGLKGIESQEKEAMRIAFWHDAKTGVADVGSGVLNRLKRGLATARDNVSRKASEIDVDLEIGKYYDDAVVAGAKKVGDQAKKAGEAIKEAAKDKKYVPGTASVSRSTKPIKLADKTKAKKIRNNIGQTMNKVKTGTKASTDEINKAIDDLVTAKQNGILSEREIVAAEKTLSKASIMAEARKKRLDAFKFESRRAMRRIKEKVAELKDRGETVIRERKAGKKAKQLANPESAAQRSIAESNRKAAIERGEDIAPEGVDWEAALGARKAKKKTKKGLSELITTKKMSSEEFEEHEHPRHKDGKFRKKNEGAKGSPKKVKASSSKGKPSLKVVKGGKKAKVPTKAELKKHAKKSPNIQRYKEKDQNKVLDWANEHKKGLLIGVGVTALAAPGAIIAKRVGDKLLTFVNYPGKTRLVPWEKLDLEQKREFFKNVEPGDIVAWGGNTSSSLSQKLVDQKLVGKYSKVVQAFQKEAMTGGKPIPDANAALHKRLIEFAGDEKEVAEYYKARDRIGDMGAQILAGGPYAHSNVVVSKMDGGFVKELNQFADELLNSNAKDIRKKKQKLGQFFQGIEGIEVRPGVFIDPFLGEGTKRAKQGLTVAQKYVSDPKYRKAVDKVLIEKYEGFPVVASGNTHTGEVNLALTWVGHESHMAIIKTKLSTGQRKSLKNGIIKATKEREKVGVDRWRIKPTKDELKKIKETGSILPMYEKYADIFARPTEEMLSPFVPTKATRAAISAIGKRRGLDLDKALNRPEKTIMNAAEPDEVLCTGYAARLLEKYAGKAHKHQNLRNVHPKTLLDDPELTDSIIEAGYEPRKVNRSLMEKLGLSKKAPHLKIVKKAMSKEEFEEHEHPRGPDGQFIDSGKAGAAPKAPKGKHGGKRVFSGRTSRYASVAVPKRMAQYKKNFPDMSDKQIEKEIRKDAERMGKPDWVEYLDNTEEYLKKEEMKREAAIRSKYNKAKLPGRGYISVKNTSDETGTIRIQTSETKAAFDREVAKQQMVRDAWKTYRNEHMDENEHRKAKMVLLAGGLATALGVAALAIGRPTFSASRGLEAMEDLGKLKYFKTFGKPGEQQIRQVSTMGAPDLLQAPKPEFIQFAKVTGKNNWSEMEKAGAINRWFTSILTSGKEGLDPKTTYAMRLGPKWKGYSSGRFKLDTHYVIDTRDKVSYGNYVPRAGDMNAVTGRVFVDKRNQVDFKVLLDDALDENRTSTVALLRNKYKGSVKVKTGKKIKQGNNNVDEEIAIEQPWNVSGNEIVWKAKMPRRDVELWLVGKGFAKRGQNGRIIPSEFLNDGEKNPLFPGHISQQWPKEHMDEWKALTEGTGAFRGYSQFFAERIIGPVSRKLFATLSISVGTGGIYYFHQDVSDFAGAVAGAEKGRIRDNTISENAARKREAAEVADLFPGGTKDDQDSASYWKQRADYEKARTKRESARASTEAIRSHNVDKVIREGLRKPSTGATTDSHTTSVYTVRRKVGSEDEKYASRFQEAAEKMGYDVGDKPIDQVWKDNGFKDVDEFHNYVWREYNSIHGEGAYERDVIDGRNSSAKGFDIEFIMKEFMGGEDDGVPDVGQEEPLHVDEITDLMALEMGKQLEDLSQSCRTMIEGGVPGHSDYEAINDILSDIYISLKRNVKSGEYDGVSSGETNSEKTTEKSTNPVDIKGSGDYMSSQDDRSAGLLVPTEDAKFCSLCNKPVSTDDIAQCDNPECPFTWLDAVIGDTDIDDKKDKEEQSDGQKQEGTEKISQASGE